MKYVLIKEGDYRGNVFNDFEETVNSLAPSDTTEQAGFYSRMDFHFRLMRNQSSQFTDHPLAVASYIVDPVAPLQDPHYFRTIDMNKLIAALDSGRDFVMYGHVTEVNVTPEIDLIKNGIYMTRNSDGELVDLDTDDRLCDVDPAFPDVAFVSVLFGLVKLGNTGIYYLIADPRLIKPIGGFDFVDTNADVSYRIISDHDGTIKENIFDYVFTGDSVAVVGKHDVFAGTGTDLVLDLTGGPSTIFAGASATPPVVDVTVNSTYPYVIAGNSITLDISSGVVGFLKISVSAGAFFEVAQRKEKPVLEFVIHPQ